MRYLHEISKYFKKFVNQFIFFSLLTILFYFLYFLGINDLSANFDFSHGNLRIFRNFQRNRKM